MVNPASTSPFPITAIDEFPLVTMPIRLTVLEAVQFKTACQKLFAESEIPRKVVLDLSETIFIDSSGIGALVSSLKLAKQKGSNLVLRNLNPQVTAVLSLTSLDKLFIIEEAPATPLSVAAAPSPTADVLPMTHPSVKSKIKRAIDIVGALVGLGITGVLLVPIVAAILIDDPGPIFFGQIRCGWMGKRFRIWKFRSMCVNAEALKSQVVNQAEGAIFKNDNDPRITRVGRIMRKTSLDELPQFWNVLKGDMSLVGTRPPTPDEVERYEIPQWQRLDVKPGMTGEWQVNGRSQVKNFEDIIQLDLRYQENWSLSYDLKLIVKTVLVLFDKKSGAV